MKEILLTEEEMVFLVFLYFHGFSNQEFCNQGADANMSKSFAI